VVLVARAVEMSVGEVVSQHCRRVGVERDVTGLAALAGQGGHGGVVQADVADGEVGEFLDPGRGVVEGPSCGSSLLLGVPNYALWLGSLP
jgi:hypothetical protein